MNLSEVIAVDVPQVDLLSSGNAAPIPRLRKGQGCTCNATSTVGGLGGAAGGAGLAMMVLMVAGRRRR